MYLYIPIIQGVFLRRVAKSFPAYFINCIVEKNCQKYQTWIRKCIFKVYYLIDNMRGNSNYNG